MLDLKRFEGKTKEEALSKGLEELNLLESQVYVNYSESEAKLFKAKKYYVDILTKDDVISYIKDYLNNFSKGMNIEIHYEVKENDGIYSVVLASLENPILIGKDGRNLNALQILLRNALLVQTGFNIKVTIDVANYKANKQKNLEFEIKKIAKDVLRSKVEVKLDPMNSYDRRIVHSVVSNFPNLETESFGETPNRYVVIRYKED